MSTLLYLLAGVGLVAMGLHALFVHTHLLRQVLALNILSTGVFLLFIAWGSRSPADHADPVAQALVLTGIVVAVSATALALALAVRIKQTTGKSSLSDEADV
ncbi:NADH-quinone oxidoreductase subunit K [uncultured Meiothermus sp.]|jgi:multicomponent Na+:H+ antiporter subunit C|uniref:NADH-quinone oxidoreductase subunit K n=1 Tax=uncultured Meiothermus sp. TaxID=157471 RepID=UPI0026185EC3|nr:NADH-quinone oxidoreductase subunit K [uncultured Meiothermus sp.]